MSGDEDELGLAPNDDEDLQLVPVDDDAGKEIAPEISHKAGVRLIPVICSACRTRLYAGENQVGLWKRCPVCERLNKIYPVDPKFILTADDPEAKGGYDVSDPEISKREMFRINADYRELNSPGKKEKVEDGDFFLSPVSAQKQPMMDRMLDRFLKSDKENAAERQALKREEKIQKELDGIKKAVREGKLEEHLALTEKPTNTGTPRPPSDPVARKLAEKQRRFESAQADNVRNRIEEKNKTDSAAVLAALDAAIETVQNEPKNKKQTEQTNRSQRLGKSERKKDEKISANNETFSAASSVGLFFDPLARKRMLILTFFGLIGNLFGEKARSMIWQVLIDKVHGQTPGYSYNFSENILLLSAFGIGGFLTTVWLVLIFLYGINLFESASKGKDKIDRWMSFNLDFGFSYFGWSLLILYLSSVPGQILWFCTDSSSFSLNAFVLAIQPLLLFFIFPVLFLCLIESETFFGCFPKKTLRSLTNQPARWFRFLGSAAAVLGIPFAVFAGWSCLGLYFNDNQVMQSLLYYLIAAVLLTLAGFGMLIYFRLLGQLAFDIRK